MKKKTIIDDETKAARFGYEIKQAFADTRRFCAEGLKVMDPQGRLVHFVWNPAQDKLDEAIRKQRAKGHQVRLMILKSRRVGFSTGVAGVIFKETAFVDGQSALIVAHGKKAVIDSIFPMYDRFQKHYKPFMDIVKQPALATDTQEGLSWENGSSIQIHTAGNWEGTRSFNYRRVHLSEYAFYGNLKRFMTALIPTIPDDPDTMVIKETTANGYNEFYDEWMLAAEGKSNYLPIFFGCYDDPNNWKALTEDPELFRRSLTEEEWELKHNYDLDLEQLNWRRHKLNDYRGDEDLFNQEYLDCAQTAFMISGRPRFNPKFFIYMPLSDGLKGELEKADLGRGSEKMVFTPNPHGALTIFSHPEANRFYVGGVDPSRGIDINDGVGTSDPDYSVAEIFDQHSYDHVAELRERIEPVPLARYLYDLGEYYKWVYWVIEVETNGGNGLAVIRELERLGYPSHLIYHMQVIDEDTKRATDKPGYIISGKSKQTLMGNWERMLFDHDVILRSKVAVAEHRTFVKKANGAVGAQSGRHDDCVSACMYGGIAMTEAPNRRLTSTQPGVSAGAPAYRGGFTYGPTVRERVTGTYTPDPPRDYEQEELNRRRRKLMRGDYGF